MGHATWQELVCDKCGRAAGHEQSSGPTSHLVRNSDAEEFLDHWRNLGWVYHEGQWICPTCVEKMKEKGLL